MESNKLIEQEYQIKGTLKEDLELGGEGAMNLYMNTQIVIVKKGDFVNVSKSSNNIMGDRTPKFTFYDKNGKELGIRFASTDEIQKKIQ
tara:strand:+ start:2218 stop:2484 length:267 start_codon:yes stop_codon:yes gene_type:complete